MSASEHKRWILHADMDAFYAAVEQRDNPELRGKPVLVGSPSGRGVVTTASYEARPYKVGSAMPMAQALRRCPHAIVVPPRFSRYEEVSRQIMALFEDVSPAVEPLSLDEAFVDLTGTGAIHGGPRAAAYKLKRAVLEATQLVVSVGVSGTKYVAKVASDVGKPDGLVIVPQEDAVRFLAPLPVKRLWGAGPKTVDRLNALGYEHIGDIAQADPRDLFDNLGQQGLHFRRLANAKDPRPVQSHRGMKSIGSERTLADDIRDLDKIKLHLRRSADEIGRRLRKKHIVARGVRVKLKTFDFVLQSRQLKLTRPTQSTKAIYDAGVVLLSRFSHDKPYRLVGMAACDLEPIDGEQLDLFNDGLRHGRLERALDSLKSRFGNDAVFRAEDLETGGPERQRAPRLDGEN